PAPGFPRPALRPGALPDLVAGLLFLHPGAGADAAAARTAEFRRSTLTADAVPGLRAPLPPPCSGALADGCERRPCRDRLPRGPGPARPLGVLRAPLRP